MLTSIHEDDDRKRGLQGLVLSVAQKDDGTVRLFLDRVVTTSGTVPNSWDFKVFDCHFEIDQAYLHALETELSKPEVERTEEGIGVPDGAVQSIGHALLVHILAAAFDARKAAFA